MAYLLIVKYYLLVDVIPFISLFRLVFVIWINAFVSCGSYNHPLHVYQ